MFSHLAPRTFPASARMTCGLLLAGFCAAVSGILPAAAEPAPRMVLVELFTTRTEPTTGSVRSAVWQLREEVGPGHLEWVEWSRDGLIPVDHPVRREHSFEARDLPEAVFDGVETVIKSGFGVINDYRPITASHLAAGSPIEITAQLLIDPSSRMATLHMTAQVADGETLPNPWDCGIQGIVIENHATDFNPYGPNQVNRLGRLATTPRPLLLGSITTEVFSVDAWDPAELKAFVVVRRMSTGEILQMAVAAPSGAVSVETRSWARIKSLYLD